MKGSDSSDHQNFTDGLLASVKLTWQASRVFREFLILSKKSNSGISLSENSPENLTIVIRFLNWKFWKFLRIQPRFGWRFQSKLFGPWLWSKCNRGPRSGVWNRTGFGQRNKCVSFEIEIPEYHYKSRKSRSNVSLLYSYLKSKPMLAIFGGILSFFDDLLGQILGNYLTYWGDYW